MKMIYDLLSQLFKTRRDVDTIPSGGRSFFDYSATEKIKILRAAGREAQKEQQQLLKAYDKRFGKFVQS